MKSAKPVRQGEVACLLLGCWLMFPLSMPCLLMSSPSARTTAFACYTNGQLQPAGPCTSTPMLPSRPLWIDDNMTKGDSLDWYPDPVKGCPRYLAGAVPPGLGDDDNNKHGIASSSDKENINPQPAKNQKTRQLALSGWLGWFHPWYIPFTLVYFDALFLLYLATLDTVRRCCWTCCI